MIEYTDVDERRAALTRLRGIEDRVWVRVGDQEAVFAIADEDLPREDDTKTSSVHFLRFQLAPAMIAALRQGADLAMGIDHPNYRAQVQVPDMVRDSLARDLTV